jgi:hypothetical protein
MVQAVHRVAEADCPHLWTEFSRLCGPASMMRAIIRRAMPAGNIRQIVQKAEQLDAASSGNMTTVRMAVHAVKSASSDSVFCVPDTPRGSVVVPG